MAMRKRDEEVVFPNAAGIDVGASSHWVAVPRHATAEPVREFGAMTDDLSALADWLLGCGVDVVALESTGVYWIPIYEVLERRGLQVWLVDARQMKYVPGRKQRRAGLSVVGRSSMSLGRCVRAGGPATRLCGRARWCANVRVLLDRAGRLGTAHAKGAGADGYPAHPGSRAT